VASSPLLAELRRRFERPGSVRFSEGPGGLVRVVIESAGAEAQVYLHGAHVTHYAPAGRKPLLFTSTRSAFARDRAIRGGIPIVFPWFGPRAGAPGAPQHGFARLTEWRVLGVETSDRAASLVLGLASSDATRAAWAFDFEVRYRIMVGAGLDLALEVRNTSARTVTFEEALHTYLAVADVTEVTVTGLAGATYIDKTDGLKRKRQDAEPVRIAGETDRMYLDTRAACVVDDPPGGRRLVVAKAGSATTVVWNPWRDKATTIADLGADEWRSMLCIETANAADDAVTLPPGGRHEMRASISEAPYPLSEPRPSR
jgi:D-hexose-6-phosphate mutarotase